ncbi:hypothetical protein F5884DRAFT_785200 [Xylogone sp. PMI_703]|nr:hypothetical protein F5884DRAFT_785200 [Xylogone sp. PMI_703]
MATSDPWAIIVGAGPSGLLLALLLAKNGVPVHVVDMNDKLDERPRATHYGPPAVHELVRAGVAHEIREKGFVPGAVAWRKLDGTIIAKLENKAEPGDILNEILCLPLNQLGQILLRHVSEQPSAKVSWSHKVVGLGQDDEKAWVDVETPEGNKRLEAQYIVGCDGANSQVRRSLFGDFNFPGKTWDEQLVATNTYYPFEKYGYLDSQFFVDREHWHMAARITTDGMWRVTYGEKSGLTNEELLARQPAKFEAMLPGHPKPDSGAYRLTNISPYRVHQRLAEKMRVGRFLLAADAAHLCNPFGGLGLTGGIVDIGGAYDCLVGIFKGLATPDILDKYDEIRRKMYLEIINPISSDNMTRLFNQDPDEALTKDAFFQMCKKAETDPEFSRQMQRGTKAVMHDFTQYYDRKPN